MNSEVVFGLESATWPALLVDADGVILTANEVAKNIFGTALSDDAASLVSLWSPENSGTAAEFLARSNSSAPAILKFQVAGSAEAFSAVICPSSGDEKKQFLLQLLPPGAPEPKAAPASDAALKQKLDCVLQLARTVSLDFNNALTGVLAHTSLVLGKIGADHPCRNSLLEVEKSAARAAEIASDLAVFSRQEKQTRRTPTGNLNLLTSRCVEFFQNAHGPRFTWRLTLERALFMARFDEAKVQQALTKVLENAVEAFAPGATGQISVQTRNVELTEATQDRNVRLAAGNYVCVEISDKGLGIETESLPRIFEPFFTTKRAPHRGLGLALVYGIITNHGGGVAISSQPAQGTSARVYLPAERGFVLEALDTDKGLRGTGTILVVDDEILLLTMAETILSDFGYKVLTASNGQKALQILGQPGTKVDLVITDLVMPGMGGRELIEKIRQTEPALPLLCTSGYVVPADNPTQAGGGSLQKPITSTELLLKVRTALRPTTAVD